MTANALTTSAFAKINLTLDVGARRPDGYHEIRSVMQTIGLHDMVTITRTPEEPGVRLEVVGDEAGGVPVDASNLVHRAAVRLQKIAAGRQILSGRQSGLHLRLEKRIPSQAGLGGGSSDAAATLRAVSALFGLNLSPQRLTALGTELGADVPFFLTGGTALVEGLGERVMPLPPVSPAWPLVIVKPPVGISTAWAYGALDALSGRRPGQATADWLAGGTRPGNDFERVALTIPEIAAVYALLHDAPEREPQTPPLLCGSGSAMFCRVHDHAAAEDLAGRVLRAGGGQAWVTGTVGSIG